MSNSQCPDIILSYDADKSDERPIVTGSISGVDLNIDLINKDINKILNNFNDQIPNFIACNINKYANNINFSYYLKILIICILIIPLIQLLLTIYLVM